MLALTWTIVHPIDENSPINGFSHSDLKDADVEFMLIVKGINDTFSQTIHARTSYTAEEVVWDAKFTPIYQGRNHKTYVDMNRIGNYFSV